MEEGGAVSAPVSRQRRWQLRQRAAGRCIFCGAPAEKLPGSKRPPYSCLAHSIERRERLRTVHGYERRNTGAASYRAGEEAR